jgi:hypothetical protein
MWRQRHNWKALLQKEVSNTEPFNVFYLFFSDHSFHIVQSLKRSKFMLNELALYLAVYSVTGTKYLMGSQAK